MHFVVLAPGPKICKNTVEVLLQAARRIAIQAFWYQIIPALAYNFVEQLKQNKRNQLEQLKLHAHSMRPHLLKPAQVSWDSRAAMMSRWSFAGCQGSCCAYCTCVSHQWKTQEVLAMDLVCANAKHECIISMSPFQQEQTVENKMIKCCIIVAPKSKDCQGVHGLPNAKCPCTQCLSKMLVSLGHCMGSPLPCSGHRKKNTRHCFATHADQIASRICAKQDLPAALSQESGCHHHIKAVH